MRHSRKWRREKAVGLGDIDTVCMFKHTQNLVFKSSYVLDK